MKKETLSVVSACLVGAFVGTVVALDLSQRFEYGKYFWIVGAFFGGITAYIVVDFKKLRVGIAQAYQEVGAWKPVRSYWQAVGMMHLALLVAVITVFIIGKVEVSILSVVMFGGILPISHDLVVSLSIPLVSLWILFIIVWSGDFPREFDNTFGKSRSCYSQEAMKNSRDIIRRFNLISILISTPIILMDLCLLLISGVRALPRFLRRVFVLVHSERRRLCFMDATLGASVGYLTGSAIIGGLVGAMLGAVSYELISVRWLKLAPVRNS